MKGCGVMKCAIITCSEYKRKIFSPAFFTDAFALPYINESILIINLPYTTDKFYNLSSEKRKKIAVKICRILYSENIFCIHLAGITDCSEFSYLKNQFHYPDGKLLLKKYAGIGACRLCSQLKLDISDVKIALYQKDFNHTGFEILCDLAQHFKNITIIGSSSEILDNYSNQLINIYGLSVNISTDISSVNSCDLLFLLDEAEKFCIKGETVILDLIKKYPFYCLNSLKFELPSGFNKLLPYFGAFDDICLEFIIFSANFHNSSKEHIFKIINNFGGVFKRFCATSKNRA